MLVNHTSRTLARITVWVMWAFIGACFGVAFAVLMAAQSWAQTPGWAPILAVPVSPGPFFEAPAAPPPLFPPLEPLRFVPTWTPVPREYVLPPVEPLRFPDLSFHGYQTGRIIPRDFMDINGQLKW